MALYLSFLFRSSDAGHWKTLSSQVPRLCNVTAAACRLGSIDQSRAQPVPAEVDPKARRRTSNACDSDPSTMS
jgi:hypothetical protein